ncbi:MAG TPA: NAD(P)/FAD-dependent oxidoreductase [Stenomitos sp.]
MRRGTTRILIVGGGFGGTYTALALEKAMRRRRDLEVTLINRANFFLYFPLLPEVVSDGVDARHVVVPLRTLFKRVRVVEAEVRSVDEGRREVLAHRDGMQEFFPFDQLVLATGAEANLAAFSGIEPIAFPFKSAEDAIALHNQIVDCFEAAEFAMDAATRRALLTFAVVGGGSTGVECLGEIEAYVNGIIRYYPRLDRHDVRLVLIELADHLINEVGPELGAYAADQLVKRGIEVHLGVSVQNATSTEITLSDGLVIPTQTLVWTIGMTPGELVKSLDLPKDRKGYLQAENTMAIAGHPGLWAIGDCAKIPSPEGTPYPPTAQHAEREAKRLACNILASIDGAPPKPYVFHTLATFVSIGGQKGVAMVRGRPVRGFLAWLLWRAVHLTLLPGLNRKLHVLVDWLFSRRFRKDIVELGLRRPPSQMVVRTKLAFLREGTPVPSSPPSEPPLI